ncbi:ER membrane protein DP1/Yop1 [Coemansia sp. RSA 2167]|nr:ER membrane protein DP1/Yop1 [Coemansia sp. RSA 2167]KAJ2152392.1 ER membrane protein DP1/Yop1 [Coemansia sp. RSA 637]KAJ2165196.1 ER membrane protein DP1/Yop1 [Coemansia sp. RSA 562]KAJ2183948.1 ER membrane protein DP1/Yop1 [Coemansia sp. RSA 532]KAJ2198012.1 ER membrane protein DP1/Yop1 [Coemansia sp. RSA 522]KAJ2207038.1 ER membrane protein DP1/Yop1 [Coemansia sp. RSA 521]KAJ2220761.1 ER membrane protein DP1/Yop1 [Coemansia sp. RSA 518]KAJ2275995.1 ER membrane protein DP1/Yop1 [Coemans
MADAHLAKIPLAQAFQEKTRVPKVYGAAGVAGAGLLLVFLNIGAALLVNLTGFGYAAFASMQAIETRGQQDDAQWLTYWVVFGMFNVLEYFAGFVVYWFPFYYLAKLGFLVWMMMPGTRGAERLYYSGIKPLVLHVRSTRRKTPVAESAPESVPAPESAPVADTVPAPAQDTTSAEPNAKKDEPKSE